MKGKDASIVKKPEAPTCMGDHLWPAPNKHCRLACQAALLDWKNSHAPIMPTLHWISHRLTCQGRKTATETERTSTGIWTLGQAMASRGLITSYPPSSSLEDRQKGLLCGQKHGDLWPMLTSITERWEFLHMSRNQNAWKARTEGYAAKPVPNSGLGPMQTSRETLPGWVSALAHQI